LYKIIKDKELYKIIKGKELYKIIKSKKSIQILIYPPKSSKTNAKAINIIKPYKKLSHYPKRKNFISFHSNPLLKTMIDIDTQLQ
jgi:hypothetical protein